MGTAKPGLTGERHREIAAELHQIRERLAQLAIEVGHAYPRIETLGTNLRGALNRVDTARRRAESLMVHGR